jgi:hypothetical protein
MKIWCIFRRFFKTAKFRTKRRVLLWRERRKSGAARKKDRPAVYRAVREDLVPAKIFT